MNKKIFSFFFITFYLAIIILIANYYFSEKNRILINKSRSSYSLNFNENLDDLIILKNDTNNVIVYLNELQDFKIKRKRRFWEKLISDKNNNE